MADCSEVGHLRVLEGRAASGVLTPVRVFWQKPLRMVSP
jgi:hypothetical protein